MPFTSRSAARFTVRTVKFRSQLENSITREGDVCPDLLWTVECRTTEFGSSCRRGHQTTDPEEGTRRVLSQSQEKNGCRSSNTDSCFFEVSSRVQDLGSTKPLTCDWWHRDSPRSLQSNNKRQMLERGGAELTQPSNVRRPRGHAVLAGIVAGVLSGLISYLLLGIAGLISGLIIGAMVGYRTALYVSDKKGQVG